MGRDNRWREQAAAKIKRKYHPGRGKDDPGPLGPMVLELLDRAEHLVDELERINGKRFDRYDTDKGNGIDLPEILHLCVYWGKFTLRPESRRSHRYELLRIRDSYNATKDSNLRDDLFQETWTRAMDLAKSKGSGNIGDPYKVEMQRELYIHLRKKFGDHVSDGKIAEIIQTLLEIVGMGTSDSESITKAIRRRMNEPMSGYAERMIRLRQNKAKRITGNLYGIVK